MSCAICLEEITADETVLNPCGHSFHTACIDQWRRGTCPVCRGRAVNLVDDSYVLISIAEALMLTGDGLVEPVLVVFMRVEE